MPHCHTFLARLRSEGYRVTPQREMVIQVIAHSGRHMTAEEVHSEVRERSEAVNIATVYRTLDLLVELGMASRSDLGGGTTVYATSFHGSHVHLVCRQCGSVIEMDAAPFTGLFESIAADHGFVCGPTHFGVSGLCSDCGSHQHGHGDGE